MRGLRVAGSSSVEGGHEQVPGHHGLHPGRHGGPERHQLAGVEAGRLA
ncbi:hypothetical protein JNW89_33265, partial [Micromonospora sp. 4G55]|nr:hypothetical protein [Micromonospora sp. 4G55]